MRILFTLILLAIPLLPLHAEEIPVTRAEGLDLLWQPLKRTIEKTNETPFTDVPESHPLSALISFAKARGIVEDGGRFFPDEPLRLKDALLWLLRSRNTTQWSALTPETASAHAKRYAMLQPLAGSRDRASLRKLLAKNPALSREDLITMVSSLDKTLTQERHTISYYGNDFAGRRTAFGEVFDPGTMTAAHRTLPQNTLVKVTNPKNGNSVVVRINDRGPYVTGRDMDVSRAAFEHLAPISNGVLHGITFKRLGGSDRTEQRQESASSWYDRHVERRHTRRAMRQ